MKYVETVQVHKFLADTGICYSKPLLGLKNSLKNTKISMNEEFHFSDSLGIIILLCEATI